MNTDNDGSVAEVMTMIRKIMINYGCWIWMFIQGGGTTICSF